eukprot:CAMPEP_0205852400 /NCGR_PEP_ID=MMETSP1083-20121108/1003_1 /ASSEMBLY_ACC=CAM_ASM_000430 /TAXON_ID=97485 /ORGANISM="Prymnesium parvum, Strain Texoma1" /LENGTH=886 /DNA_ID=CAMNT_0053213609 /DNA_START=1 /DNA_END=2663 /DNA_ORIENTATION=-
MEAAPLKAQTCRIHSGSAEGAECGIGQSCSTTSGSVKCSDNSCATPRSQKAVSMAISPRPTKEIDLTAVNDCRSRIVLISRLEWRQARDLSSLTMAEIEEREAQDRTISTFTSFITGRRGKGGDEQETQDRTISTVTSFITGRKGKAAPKEHIVAQRGSWSRPTEDDQDDDRPPFGTVAVTKLNLSQNDADSPAPFARVIDTNEHKPTASLSDLSFLATTRTRPAASAQVPAANANEPEATESVAEPPPNETGLKAAVVRLTTPILMLFRVPAASDSTAQDNVLLAARKGRLAQMLAHWSSSEPMIHTYTEDAPLAGSSGEHQPSRAAAAMASKATAMLATARSAASRPFSNGALQEKSSAGLEKMRRLLGVSQPVRVLDSSQPAAPDQAAAPSRLAAVTSRLGMVTSRLGVATSRLHSAWPLTSRGRETAGIPHAQPQEQPAGTLKKSITTALHRWFSTGKLEMTSRVQMPTSALLCLNDGRMGFFVVPQAAATELDAFGKPSKKVFHFVYVIEVRRLRVKRWRMAHMALNMLGDAKRGYECTYKTSPLYGKNGEVQHSEVVLDAEWGRACALLELGADGDALARAAYEASKMELGSTKSARRRTRFLRQLMALHGHKLGKRKPSLAEAHSMPPELVLSASARHLTAKLEPAKSPWQQMLPRVQAIRALSGGGKSDAQGASPDDRPALFARALSSMAIREAALAAPPTVEQLVRGETYRPLQNKMRLYVMWALLIWLILFLGTLIVLYSLVPCRTDVPNAPCLRDSETWTQVRNSFIIGQTFEALVEDPLFILFALLTRKACISFICCEYFFKSRDVLEFVALLQSYLRGLKTCTSSLSVAALFSLGTTCSSLKLTPISSASVLRISSSSILSSCMQKKFIGFFL